MESQLEKEARFCQLMAHSSHDSAIDTDSLEWETEVVEFEKDRVRQPYLCLTAHWTAHHVCCSQSRVMLLLQEDMDLKALGFDVAEGLNDPYLPGDCGIYVSKVDKGSIAEGRLRYLGVALPNAFEISMLFLNVRHSCRFTAGVSTE